jgi:hypothetical protein
MYVKRTSKNCAFIFSEKLQNIPLVLLLKTRFLLFTHTPGSSYAEILEALYMDKVIFLLTTLLNFREFEGGGL